MAEPVFTLAVWDFFERRWSALVTSRERSKLEVFERQLTSLVMAFTEIVEVPRDDDDAIVAALDLLTPICPHAAYGACVRLVELVCERESQSRRSLEVQ